MVALLGGNRAEAWCAGAAALASGLAVTWLHPLGSVADQLHQLQDSGARLLVIDETRFAERGGALEPGCTELAIRQLTLGPSDLAPDLATMSADAPAAGPRDLAAPTDLSNIGYTGGTTGVPKGAFRSHRSNVAVATQILAGFELPAVPKFLAVAPISHAAGTKVVPTLLRGGTVHLVTGFDPGHIAKVIARERIDTTLLVPTMIHRLIDAPEAADADLSSLRLVLYGAAPISPQLLDAGLDRLGPVFGQMFGQTECYPITMLRRDDHRPDDPDLLRSTGFPLPGTTVEVRDTAGTALPAGEVGELWVRSPAAMDGYWRRPELTAETIVGGHLRTGDLARIDERGYVHLVDRAADLIISGGFNVYPRAVEDALTAHPQVAAAAVYGVPDPRWGEAVTATVVRRPAATVTADELRAHVRDRRGPVPTPRTIDFVDALPLTALGKVDKKALRARHLAGPDSART